MTDRLIIEVVNDGNHSDEDLADAVRQLRQDLREVPEFEVSDVEGAPAPGTRADPSGIVELVAIGLWTGYQIGRTEAAHKLLGILENWAERSGSRFRFRVGDKQIEGRNISGKDLGEIARYLGMQQVDLSDEAKPASSSARKKH